MVDLSNFRIYKKVKKINNKITYDLAEFILNCHFIEYLLENVFEINNRDKLQKHIEYKLLNYRE